MSFKINKGKEDYLKSKLQKKKKVYLSDDLIDKNTKIVKICSGFKTLGSLSGSHSALIKMLSQENIRHSFLLKSIKEEEDNRDIAIIDLIYNNDKKVKEFTSDIEKKESEENYMKDVMAGKYKDQPIYPATIKTPTDLYRYYMEDTKNRMISISTNEIFSRHIEVYDKALDKGAISEHVIEEDDEFMMGFVRQVKEQLINCKKDRADFLREVTSLRQYGDNEYLKQRINFYLEEKDINLSLY